jgi:hypothetical protein
MTERVGSGSGLPLPGGGVARPLDLQIGFECAGGSLTVGCQPAHLDFLSGRPVGVAGTRSEMRSASRSYGSSRPSEGRSLEPAAEAAARQRGSDPGGVVDGTARGGQSERRTPFTVEGG